MNRTLGLLVVATALAPLSAPTTAEAQWPTTTTVECLSPSGLACTGLRFFIDASGTNRLTAFAIANKKPAYFNFASVLSFTNASGQPVGWLNVIVDLARHTIEFVAGAGKQSLEPLYVTLSLTPGSTGTAAQAYDGGFTYAAVGYLGTTGTTPLVAHGNVTGPLPVVPPPVILPPPPVSVTPEPASMILLGSGLAGLGALARRRRSALPRGREA